MDEGNWQPAVAGVNAKGKKNIITNGKRKHVGKDDVTEGNDEERRAFLEAFERDEACRKRDDALMAACLAYESDYSNSDYSDSTTLWPRSHPCVKPAEAMHQAACEALRGGGKLYSSRSAGGVSQLHRLGLYRCWGLGMWQTLVLRYMKIVMIVLLPHRLPQNQE